MSKTRRPLPQSDDTEQQWPDLRELLGFATLHTNPIALILEEFVVAGTHVFPALVSRNSDWQFRKNLHAAASASTLGLAGLDYARRAYPLPIVAEDERKLEASRHLYIDAYMFAKAMILDALRRLQPKGKPEPEIGEFGASVALERLPASFFAAHLLYSVGCRFEGHAVARLILEQLAWAYVVSTETSLEVIKKVSATQSVSQLKHLVPHAGKLYGFLSKATHIQYETHADFLYVDNDRPAVRHTHSQFGEYTRVLFILADLFVVVWELSQHRFIDEFRAIAPTKTGYNIRPDRILKTEYERYVAAVDEAERRPEVGTPKRKVRKKRDST